MHGGGCLTWAPAPGPGAEEAAQQPSPDPTLGEGGGVTGAGWSCLPTLCFASLAPGPIIIGLCLGARQDGGVTSLRTCFWEQPATRCPQLGPPPDPAGTPGVWMQRVRGTQVSALPD